MTHLEPEDVCQLIADATWKAARDDIKETNNLHNGRVEIYLEDGRTFMVYVEERSAVWDQHWGFA